MSHNHAVDARLDAFLDRCLLLDLETGPNGALHKIGAVRGGIGGGEVFLRQGRFDEATALAELDRFAGDKELVLGHNLLGHDLHALRARRPTLRLLGRRIVDTLFLSPLAFPENPYHHLVKDYKLVRDAVSDPVADCRLAARVFRDQWAELKRRDQGVGPSPLPAYRYCFRGALELESNATGGNGVSLVFAALGAELVDLAGVLALLERLWAGRTCVNAWRAVALDHLRDPELRPALAYATAWLQVAGARSVLPHWVRHRFPSVPEMIRTLRARPCDDPSCTWCRASHDPRGQLQRWFGFDAFRPEPRAADGRPLQEAVVEHGMADGSQLAILPTGGGKSLCFQLPALVRNQRTGALTVVISPLQALMKDQVDNLARKTGTTAAVALYGMLTPPERGQVLERIRLGDAAILYLSPEQLRNASVTNVLRSREIGCWVFDEAHCLSKWGHDFRPDYLYAGRFIKDLAASQGVGVPPVACFTATAKREVTAEIRAYFQEHLDLDLRLFEGGVERDNLSFEVQVARAMEKDARVLAILDEHLAKTGAAVVYASTRARTEKLRDTLIEAGWPAAAFHAGLKAPEKRDIQDAFVRGDLRVICATNAFGMGVDKDDVRLVIHLDIPGSLESYVQEAGRAGRDREPALCILLYDEQDVERQFRMESLGELSRQDIAQILRGLRRARRGGEDSVVLTSGELLRDDDLRLGFDIEDRAADTKVRVAVAWLERAGLVERNENRTRVFQGRPAVASIEDAERRIERLGLSAAQQGRWLAVLEALINADPDEGFTADELARLPAFSSDGQADWDKGETAGLRVIRTLHDMAEAGLLQRGPQLSAFIRHRVKRPSEAILKQVCDLERAMIEALKEAAPDAGTEDWQPLSLRRLNQHLRDTGHETNPETLRNLLASLARDGRGIAAARGSLEFRQVDRDHYRVRLHRDWPALTKTALRRQAVAGVVLRTLIAKIPPEAPAGAETLVSFGTDELTRALQADLSIGAEIRDPLAAADRGLMFLHEQGAIVLQRGLAVFRQAMTIRLLPEAARRKYTKAQYQPLSQHYGERTFQIHAMNEYARLGVERIRQALALVTAYFTLDKSSFVRRFFPDRREVLERATTAESFRRIVDALGNPAQTEIVAADPEANRLILAGPGSGKTRVVVHRAAYLLRVLRVDPRGILVLCYNRSAALELRRRLAELVGSDAAGVTVATFHGFAMRLTGSSFAERAAAGDVAGDRDRSGPDFSAVMTEALDLLEGRTELTGIEPDAVRDRLLAGYRHILVDEYQDIDETQYRLVAAIAGRSLEADEGRLTLLAVGDDDQAIYGFRGASSAFIRRFQSDYEAEVHYLVESYRSTAHICAAANALISQNRGRMKQGQEIRVDRRRRDGPPGGRWERLDPHGRGRVEVLELPDPGRQAAALIARIRRLRELGGDDWSAFAVLAYRHETLQPIRAVCEATGIPVAWRGEAPPLHRVREIALFLDHLAALGNQPVTADALLAERPEDSTPWDRLVRELLLDWRGETANAPVAAALCLEHCYETLGEQRRDGTTGTGVLLSTLHGAKGLEFPHVLIADGPGQLDTDADEQRRLYYVGMTRARETLTLGRLPGGSAPDPERIDGDWLLSTRPEIEPPSPEILARRYDTLTPADIDIGYAGRRPADDQIHRRLAAVRTGDRLCMQSSGDSVRICSDAGAVARLSKRAATTWRERLDQIESVRIIAMLRRKRTDGDPSFRDACRCEDWEYPLVELVWYGVGRQPL